MKISMNILRKMGLTSHKKSSTQPLYTRYVFRKTRDGQIIDNVSHRYIGDDSKNVINNIDMYRLTVFRMGFFGAAHVLGGGGGRKALSLKSVTHILQWENLAQLYLTQRRSKKYMNHVTHPLSSADISIFSPEISKFCYIKKYRYRLYFDT